MFILFVSIVTVQIYMSDLAATAGSDLTQIESEIRVVEKENEYLKNQYLSMTSLSNLRVMALENGYIESSVEFLISPKLASR